MGCNPGSRGLMVLRLTSSFRDHNEYVAVFMDCVEAIKPFIPSDTGCTVCMKSGDTHSVFETADSILEWMQFDEAGSFPFSPDDDQADVEATDQ